VSVRGPHSRDGVGHRLALLRRVASSLGGPQPFEHVVDELLASVVELTGAERGYLVLGDRDGDRVYWHGEPVTRVSRRLADQVRSEARPLVILDAESDPSWSGSESLMDMRVRSAMAAPVSVEGERIGVLAVDTSTHLKIFKEDDLEVMMLLAEQAAVALRIHRLQEQERRLQENAIAALVRAIDARDKETIGHAGRVQSDAVLCGTALGLDAADLRALRYAALLHDIGKIAIPDDILKSSKILDAISLEEVKLHPRAGAQIIGDDESLTEVATMVRHHHERWDGKGYPDRLRGDEIPLGSRIIAVCDAFDVMISGRAYRPAVTPEIAAGELRKGAGRQFDPAVVEVFLVAKRLSAR
jgi:HD-GYP domain-containing protein (c-di-GMP phosphodiesterase class II)